MAAFHTSGVVQKTIVSDLLSYGAQVDLANRDGQCPSHLASQSGSVQLLETLLSNGANPQSIAKNRKTIDEFARATDKKSIQDVLQFHRKISPKNGM